VRSDHETLGRLLIAQVTSVPFEKLEDFPARYSEPESQ
jgi:hypothetical protein